MTEDGNNVETLFKTPEIFGPVRSGCSVFFEGRLVPNLHAYDRGDIVEFVLDGRMAWEFPKDMAHHVLGFAANAMAIGAGYPCFSADHKVEAFAVKVMQIGGGEHDA